jgi:uncharacterized membrane protein YgcG
MRELVILLILAACVGLSMATSFVNRRSRPPRAKPSHRANAAAAMNFDLRAVGERFKRDTGLPGDEVRRIEREFRRYILLVAMSPGTSLGLHNGRIDDFWHSAITFTTTYRAYCQAVAGRFIDHDPAGGGDLPYARTFAAYQAVFGETPDAELWPQPDPEHAVGASVTKPRRRWGVDAGCGGVAFDGGSDASGSSHASGHGGASHGHSCGSGQSCSGGSCSGGGCGGGGH